MEDEEQIIVEEEIDEEMEDLERELEETVIDDDEIDENYGKKEIFSKSEENEIKQLNLNVIDIHVEPKIRRVLRIIKSIQTNSKDKDNQLVAKQEEQDDYNQQTRDIAKKALKKSAIKMLWDNRSGVFCFIYAFTCMVLLGIVLGANRPEFISLAFWVLAIGLVYALISSCVMWSIPVYVMTLKMKQWLKANELNTNIDGLEEDVKTVKKKRQTYENERKAIDDRLRELDEIKGIINPSPEPEEDEEDEPEPPKKKKIKPKRNKEPSP